MTITDQAPAPATAADDQPPSAPTRVPGPPPPPPPANRHPLAAHRRPHIAVGAIVLAAAATRAAAQLTGDDASVAMFTAATAFVVAVVAATRARRRIFDPATLRRVYAFCAVATAWLTSVAATGLTLGAIGILAALGCALSMHWWHANPVGYINAVAATDPDDYEARWAANVAGPGGALPGSRLTDAEPIRAGIRFALRLVPGAQTLEMVENMLSRLRGGLEIHRYQQLIVEPHPALAEPHVLLTIVLRSPVTRGVDWPGPSAFDSKTGYVHLGPYADGEGTAKWRAYTQERLWGGFVQGGTGSGKSRLIDCLAMSLAASETHPTVLMYADGQGGASSPLLMRWADLFAGTAERTLAMVIALELLMVLRQRENVEQDLEGFTPTAARPGVLGIIDECHKFLSKAENPLHWAEIQRRAATIAREGGKVGVALVLASQEPTLKAFGGANTPYCEALRSSLLTGNGIMLAGDDPNAKTIFGISANPKKFPTGGGYGFVAKPAPGERAALFRSTFLTKQLRDTWPPRITWRSLDGTPAAAVLPNYSTRERDIRARKAAMNAVPLTLTDPALATAAGAAGTSDATVTLLHGTRPFPNWRAIEARRAQERAAAQEAAATEKHGQVVDALTAGWQKPQQIADATGISIRHVHNLLTDLLAAGRVRRGDVQGVYHLVDPAA